MRVRFFGIVLALVGASMLPLPSSADAQVIKRIKAAAERAVGSEAEAQVERLLRNAIRCVVDDPVCVEKASASGQDVIFVDDDGGVIVDGKGAPITDPAKAQAAAPRPVAPGDGAWANYDFVPGDEILFYDDFVRDNVGDFPRRFELIGGNWDVVEWEGGRYLRATSGGMVAIPLPETLPDRFTIEFPMSLRHGNAYVRLTPGRAYYGRPRDYKGSAISVEATRAGLRPVSEGPMAMAPMEHRFERDGIATLRVMADGDYFKVYLDERRVGNAPNAVFPRTEMLYLTVSSALPDRPILVGPIRVAGGGRDLYDRLERDGRVATQGILFATNSDRIRPESTPTLKEIGAMLQQHRDLRLGIEGHTDTDGDDAYNQELSERRAAAVRRHLIDRYGVDQGRLEEAGFGESRPAAGNDTPEGKQQNRRVELVKLSGSDRR
jgi:outer membrane protein OmpA-like peptidoglycan-associated protein